MGDLCQVVSERYLELTNRNYVYNIMPMDNIVSIMNHGILCYHEAEKLPMHSSIAMNDVQIRRESIQLRGKSLHDYVNMYFSYRNPMMYKRRIYADSLCVLAIASSVLDLAGCVVTDQNAASSTVRFYDADIGIEYIDYNKVFADNWIHEDDAYETAMHKKIKCAEILVPNRLSFDYVVGAYVVSEGAKKELLERGFPKKIRVEPLAFFR